MPVSRVRGYGSAAATRSADVMAFRGGGVPARTWIRLLPSPRIHDCGATARTVALSDGSRHRGAWQKPRKRPRESEHASTRMPSRCLSKLSMQKLIIDWAHPPTYTTIMGVFAGSSLISVASVGRKLLKKEVNPVGWALNFGVLGVVLLLTGGGMVLTWPMHGQPFDNMIFGETSLSPRYFGHWFGFLFLEKNGGIGANRYSDSCR